MFDLGANWHLSDKRWNVPVCPWGVVGIFHTSKPPSTVVVMGKHQPSAQKRLSPARLCIHKKQSHKNLQWLAIPELSVRLEKES